MCNHLPRRYITHLLHTVLDKRSVDEVTRSLRKLPWKGDGVEDWVIGAFLDCAAVK